MLKKRRNTNEQGRKMAEFDYEELVKATDNFNPRRIIGKGSHGTVYKGVLYREDNKSLINVAVKKQSEGLQTHDDNSKLENEIGVLSSLGESPHVLNLIGKSHDSLKKKVMVMELLPNGSLHEWLHDRRRAPPSWAKRLEMAMQVARAVQFLHSSGKKPVVIHRDIKSTNILFDSRWDAKLADFGLAVVVKGGGVVEALSQPAGTMGYIDPCYTAASKLSTKNDMFSFGVVLLEIMSGRKAIDVCNRPASVVEWAVPLINDEKGEQVMLEQVCDPRMALPSASAHMATSIAHILRQAVRCVSPNESDRPSAAEVVTGMGMERCFVERVRVRYPFWSSLLRKMKRKKLLLNVTQGDVHADTPLSSAKLSITIREVLADVTLA